MKNMNANQNKELDRFIITWEKITANHLGKESMREAWHAPSVLLNQPLWFILGGCGFEDDGLVAHWVCLGTAHHCVMGERAVPDPSTIAVDLSVKVGHCENY